MKSGLFLLLCLTCTASAERWLRPGRGPSMLPLLPERCLVEVRIVPMSEAGIGFVVMAIGPRGNRVVHEVVAFTPDGSLVIQGRNNPVPDAWVVTPARFIGIVTGYARPEAPEQIIALPVGRRSS